MAVQHVETFPFTHCCVWPASVANSVQRHGTMQDVSVHVPSCTSVDIHGWRVHDLACLIGAWLYVKVTGPQVQQLQSCIVVCMLAMLDYLTPRTAHSTERQ